MMIDYANISMRSIDTNAYLKKIRTSKNIAVKLDHILIDGEDCQQSRKNACGYYVANCWTHLPPPRKRSPRDI